MPRNTTVYADALNISAHTSTRTGSVSAPSDHARVLPALDGSTVTTQRCGKLHNNPPGRSFRHPPRRPIDATDGPLPALWLQIRSEVRAAEGEAGGRAGGGTAKTQTHAPCLPSQKGKQGAIVIT